MHQDQAFLYNYLRDFSFLFLPPTKLPIQNKEIHSVRWLKPESSQPFQISILSNSSVAIHAQLKEISTNLDYTMKNLFDISFSNSWLNCSTIKTWWFYDLRAVNIRNSRMQSLVSCMCPWTAIIHEVQHILFLAAIPFSRGSLIFSSVQNRGSIFLSFNVCLSFREIQFKLSVISFQGTCL